MNKRERGLSNWRRMNVLYECNYEIYAPEAHIMYLTVSTWFLISFVKGGSCPSRVIKFLYAPAPPLVYKTTYTPMIYTALCIRFLMHAYPLLGQVGGGGDPWKSQVFWAPNGNRLSALCHFTGPKKLSISRAHPPPTCPHNGYARIQNIMHVAV